MIPACITALLPEAHEYAEIHCSAIPFSSEVAEACRANRCGRYNTCWTCPPGVGSMETWQKQVQDYTGGLVFTYKYALEDSFDIDGMNQGRLETMALLRRMTEALSREEQPFLALGCEGCELCPTCAYPHQPCRHPDQAVVSVEACGINVVQLARNAGVRYYNGENTVTYFCVLLFR